MAKYTVLILVLSGLFLSGCYNARVTTGATPSNQTIERPWASGFLFGLVPPSTVNAANECPNGVAVVETKLSFLNMLAAGFTFNLYTPMNISVTCAAGSAELPEDAQIIDLATNLEKTDALRNGISEAAELSQKSNAPVYLMTR
ncbi:MAG: Bor family protein [Balneolales bacterium]|nr:Bor family protein [Balneolales bacterium]